MFANQGYQAGDVVGMLVSNNDRAELAGFLADQGHPPREFPQAEAGIDQEAGPPGGKQRRVARTTTGENTEFDDDRLPTYSAAFSERLPNVFSGQRRSGVSPPD